MATAILDHAVCNTKLCISLPLVSNRPFATELCLELLPLASGTLLMVSNLEFYAVNHYSYNYQGERFLQPTPKHQCDVIKDKMGVILIKMVKRCQ